MPLDDYRGRFRNIAIERDADGVLDMRLHTDGGPLKWGVDPGCIHDQLGEAFYRVGRDPGNRVVILRGTGDTFCAERNPREYCDLAGDQAQYRLIREGRDLVNHVLEIDMPMIGVVNGPATIHPEIALMVDVVLASPHACFRDSHLPGGIVPGDGGQVYWTSVLGPTRGSYFLLTEQTLSAEDALGLGAVHEIVDDARLLPRAREIAARLASKPLFTLRYTRMTLQQAFKERFAKELSLGFAAEMLAMNTAGGGHAAARK